MRGNKNNKAISTNCGLSTIFIVIIVLVVMFFTITAIITIRHITLNYTPSPKVVVKLVRNGNIDKAYAISEKLDDSSVDQIIAKVKVLIALSLKNQEKDKWRNFGQNSENWLDDDSSKKAAALLEYALQIDSGSAEGHCLLGVLQKEMGKLDAAGSNLLKAIQLKNPDCDCYLALASLYTMQSRLPDAELLLHSAADKFPENVSVMKNLGLLYRHYLQKPDSAIIWMNRYLSVTKPDDRAAGQVKQDIRELLQRYPEYASVDTSAWGSTRKFTQRKDTPFRK
ncbi:MAG TPA: hypothetical protein VHO70_00320 [Chitinispirillaceae bacterium]|nr:hypothetical protein [Chitinispirillaceae bacterium]